MPPPLTTSVVSSISSTSKSPVKKKEKSRNSESADSEYDNVPSVSTSRIVKKPETPKVAKTYKFTPINDGLETGSDSDMPEEPEKVIHTPKFGDIAKPFEPRIQNQSIPDLGLSTKSSAHEIKTKPLYIGKDEKFSTPQFKNSSPIVSNRGDFTKDYGNASTNKNDILANFETPYLSEFTRRLSSRTSINVPSASKFSPKSKFHSLKITFYKLHSFCNLLTIYLYLQVHYIAKQTLPQKFQNQTQMVIILLQGPFILQLQGN